MSKPKNSLHLPVSKSKFPLRQEIREQYAHATKMLDHLNKTGDVIGASRARTVCLALGWVLGEFDPPYEIPDE